MKVGDIIDLPSGGKGKILKILGVRQFLVENIKNKNISVIELIS